MASSLSEKPPKLSDLQDWLRAVWTTPEGIDAALRTPEGRRARKWIAEVPSLSARDRLAVYSDAYFLRLLDSLGSDFTATHRVLGDADFRRLAADYLSERGSDSPNLTDLGRGLPAAAAKHELGRKYPFLSELCVLEWTVLAALFTGRLPPFDPGIFKGMSAEGWGKVGLVFDPTVRLLETSWPVHRLWIKRAAKSGSRGLKKPSRSCLVVYRDEQWARVLDVEERAWQTLRRLMAGAPLAEACALSGAQPDEIKSWFAGWVQIGLVKDIRLPP
jgi:hypothetical protein